MKNDESYWDGVDEEIKARIIKETDEIFNSKPTHKIKVKELTLKLADKVRDLDVKKYLKDVVKLDGIALTEQFKRLKKYTDIYREFKFFVYEFDISWGNVWLSFYCGKDKVKICGYSIDDLYSKFSNQIEPIGAFNLMIDLRDNPDETLEYIKAGLPRK